AGRDGAGDELVVLHVAHRDGAMDLAHAERMQNVRHEFLEAHVLYARDAFGAQEIIGRRVTALLPFARVVHEELRDFTKRASVLAAVHDEAYAAFLRAANAFLDRVRQIRTAGADVG